MVNRPGLRCRHFSAHLIEKGESSNEIHASFRWSIALVLSSFDFIHYFAGGHVAFILACPDQFHLSAPDWLSFQRTEARLSDDLFRFSKHRKFIYPDPIRTVGPEPQSPDGSMYRRMRLVRPWESAVGQQRRQSVLYSARQLTLFLRERTRRCELRPHASAHDHWALQRCARQSLFHAQLQQERQCRHFDPDWRGH